MCGLHTEHPLSTQIKLLRKYIKLKVMADNVTFRGHVQDGNHVYDLFKRTVVSGESHSALMIGPRGSGKTTLINFVLYQLEKDVDLLNDAIIVKLNGLIHHDDKIALKSITVQMQLENAVGDRVFGTFAENLAYLLSCVQSGCERRCKSMLFILEEFDMFCHSGRTQTLLYNLFDITHSQQAPMCVLGVTNRIDVMELLEKRVKSRFSHRHIFIFPNEDHQRAPHEVYGELMVQLLSIPAGNVPKKKRSRKSTSTPMETDEELNSLPSHLCRGVNLQDLEPGFIQDWNAHIQSLTKDIRIMNGLEKLCYYTINEQIFRNILFELASKLSATHPFIDAADLTAIIDKTVAPNHRVKLIQSLSVLELSLLIAMKHGTEIFDGQPMNFEMVLSRYQKYANANSSAQSVPRPVILKAFEHLQELELIVSGTKHNNDDASSRVHKEYKLYNLAVPLDEMNDAVNGNNSLPTDLIHWYSNCDA